MPISGYFDVIFAVDGDLTSVPDGVQSSGSISYTQGWGPYYAQDPTVYPATALFIDRAQTNQLFNDLTTAIQQYQQFGTPPFITATMNGGTAYSYPQYARVLYGGVTYQSLVGSNTDTPPSAKWIADETANTRTRLSTSATYYVATTGNDSTGTGTSGNPWLTIQHAYNVISQTIDMNGNNVTIQIANGTYAAGLTASALLVGQTGPGSLTINGNSGTPDNVIISVSAGSNFTAQDGAQFTVQNMKLVNSGSAGAGIQSSSNGIINFSGIDFGTMTNVVHLSATGGAIFCVGNYSISGGAQAHYNLSSAQSVIQATSYTVTISNTPAFGTAFASAAYPGLINSNGMTFNGSATGQRYAVNANAVINTQGSGASYFPGNSAGSSGTGGQYL